MQARFPSLVLFCLALALAPAVQACSNQGEGEVCDVNAGNNGNDDCQDGLSCQKAPGLGVQSSANPYRCCPGDLDLATVPVCMLNTSPVDAGSAPPVDASGDVESPGAEDAAAEGSAAPEGGVDAAADAASLGAPSDSGPDAPGDARAE